MALPDEEALRRRMSRIGIREEDLEENFIRGGGAGERGQLVMRAVPDAETLQRDIYRLQEEDDARRRGLGQTRDEPDSANDEH